MISDGGRFMVERCWFTWSDWYVVTHWKEEPELPIVYGKECEE